MTSPLGTRRSLATAARRRVSSAPRKPNRSTCCKNDMISIVASAVTLTSSTAPSGAVSGSSRASAQRAVSRTSSGLSSSSWSVRIRSRANTRRRRTAACIAVQTRPTWDGSLVRSHPTSRSITASTVVRASMREPGSASATVTSDITALRMRPSRAFSRNSTALAR
jgi:hypothetical protein